MKIQIWNEQEARKQISQRLRDARTRRRPFERKWRENEKIVYGAPLEEGDIDSPDGTRALDAGGKEQAVSVNLAFKNIRFIHAQMSANPPVVVPEPITNDTDDRRKADAANKAVQYALREYNLQELQDRMNLNTLLYGSGFAKTVWDKDGGEPLKVDADTGDMVMEGDFSIRIPNVWNIYLDPDAEIWEDVRFVFERLFIPYEEALFRFPDKKETLERFRIRSGDWPGYTAGEGDMGYHSAIRTPKFDVVELFEYWEKGLPQNGYAGRFGHVFADGSPVTSLGPNPEQYAPLAVKSGKAARPAVALLPYHILTDIDVPNSVYGKSVLEWAASGQDKIDRMYTISLDTVQAHGIPRIITTEQAELAGGAFTDETVDVVTWSGSGAEPKYINPAPVPPVMADLLGRLTAGMNDIFGTNDALFGEQKRETSGTSMQYATNNGNLIRRRLFNKYVNAVESIYKSFLRIVCSKWDAPRTIKVIGKEKAFEVLDLKGTDIDGGYDLVTKYGTSFLDPTMRRQEITTLFPLFKEAGMDTRKLLQLMELNELPNMYNALSRAEDRQREIFEEMTATGVYIPPRELQDHKNMLMFAYDYVMTVEFKYVKDDAKVLIEKHIRDREAMLNASAPAAPAPEQAAPVPGEGGDALAGLFQ